MTFTTRDLAFALGADPKDEKDIKLKMAESAKILRDIQDDSNAHKKNVFYTDNGFYQGNEWRISLDDLVKHFPIPEARTYYGIANNRVIRSQEEHYEELANNKHYGDFLREFFIETIKEGNEGKQDYYKKLEKERRLYAAITLK